MAITHKRQDDLESMFASFAKVPKPKKLILIQNLNRKMILRKIKFYGYL